MGRSLWLTLCVGVLLGVTHVTWAQVPADSKEGQAARPASEAGSNDPGAPAAPLSDLEKLQRLIEQMRARRAARPPAAAAAKPGAEPAPAEGFLRLKLPALPGPVQLAIDGADRGAVEASSIEPLALPPGAHEVRVARPGFAPFTKAVKIRPGRTTALEVRLKARAAVLRVDTDVPGAEVLVDGAVVGRAPIVGLELPPRVVTVSARSEGRLEASATVVLALGEEKAVSFTLERAQPSAAIERMPPPSQPRPTTAATTDRPVEQPLVPEDSAAADQPVVVPAEGAGGQAAAPGAAPARSGVAWYVWTAAAVAVAAAGAGAAYYVYARPLTPAEVCTPETCGGCINMSCLRASPAAPPVPSGAVLRW